MYMILMQLRLIGYLIKFVILAILLMIAVFVLYSLFSNPVGFIEGLSGMISGLISWIEKLYNLIKILI